MYPKLRFKGFDDAWEQRKLSELATMHARIGWQNLRTSEFLDSGDYMLITGTDFEDGKVNYSTCHYVEKERYDQDKNIQIKNGSILITKDGTLGKVAYVEGLSMPATLNAGVFNVEVRNENETDRKYLFQFLKAPFLMDYVAQKATGGTIKHLNQNILVDFPIAMPSKAEQIRIGEYFTNIDNLITLHQRQCEALKKQKRFFLQNMFPKEGESEPRIRFNGFTEPWEQRKLGELAPLRGGFAFKSEKFTTAGIPIVKISNILQDGSVGSDFSRYEMIPDDENFTLRNGDTVLAMSGATTGKVSVLTCTEDEKYYQNQRVGFFTRKGNFNYDFVSVIVRSHLFIEQLKSVLVAGAQPNVSPKDIDSFEFMVPQKFVEQEKIGHFFKSLDKLITLHQRQYEQLVSLKKYLLSKMFI